MIPFWSHGLIAPYMDAFGWYVKGSGAAFAANYVAPDATDPIVVTPGGGDGDGDAAAPTIFPQLGYLTGDAAVFLSSVVAKSDIEKVLETTPVHVAHRPIFIMY